ncbi:hypothetical protein BB559_000680 [Furculomyces boomerangus]|uniref:Adenosylmethionine decarboxylase n=2 Tax=Harpellales TaxID=61421 RepID=A0A2T9Z4D8_9FUNG|nr:hypothetical protein BB559_000680 [Furculomyces boomerangus]PVZ99640.1 hypothetical protein BB558_004326 [Smittium angustum]
MTLANLFLSHDFNNADDAPQSKSIIGSFTPDDQPPALKTRLLENPQTIALPLSSISSQATLNSSSSNSYILCTDSPPTSNTADTNNYTGCFEGQEKLLEIWFSTSAEDIPSPSCDQFDTKSSLKLQSPDPEDIDEFSQYRTGLRLIPKRVLRDMLDLVHCSVLDSFSNAYIDSYLLSESSMFMYPHKIVIKTCGTTTLLLALERILDLARIYCSFKSIHRVFYSRKSFMFPENQPVPHNSWDNEVSHLDTYFENGSSYIIGDANTDHWYLYMATPKRADEQTAPGNVETSELSETSDTTIEILMTGLNPSKMEKFYCGHFGDSSEGLLGGKLIEKASNISDIYPDATCNSYLFYPCGFSSNAILGEHYFNIHVTPEPSCSFASFESNIPLSIPTNKDSVANLVSKVIDIFSPTQFTVTIFKDIHQHSKDTTSDDASHTISSEYKSSDRIVYKLDGYWLQYNHYIRA